MNKQELAARIWKSANDMRSKIEANDYKDYILGFIFYKFLSDKELDGLLAKGWTKKDLEEYWDLISMFPMSATLFRHSREISMRIIRRFSRIFSIL